MAVITTPCSHLLLPSSPCSTLLAPLPFHANRLQHATVPKGVSHDRIPHVSACLGISHSFEPGNDDDGILSSNGSSREQMQAGLRLDFPVASELDEGASTAVQDWRTFRAHLCKANSGRRDLVAMEPCGHADERWAHEIGMPEVGCILVATEKLDNHPLLHKSVVLLLSSDCGSFRGVMLNRKLPFALEQLNHVDMGVILGLQSCPVILGGPISSSSTFHLLTPHCLQGFTSVLPGLRVAADQPALLSCWNSIKRNQIAAKDLHVHIGELEWDLEILTAEVKVLQWWRLVSCSTCLLLEEDVERMWERIDSLISKV